MTRPLPLHVVLGRMTHDAREARAAEILTLGAVRDAASKAARQGLALAVIPLGPVTLEHTAAARALIAQLKGFSFEWVETIGRDGAPQWELRLLWQALAPASPV